MKETPDMASLEDGRRGHKPRNVGSLKARGDKEQVLHQSFQNTTQPRLISAHLDF